MEKDAPINEWLVCSNFDTSPKRADKFACHYFFAYKDAEGNWWKELDESGSESMDEPAAFYRIR